MFKLCNVGEGNKKKLIEVCAGALGLWYTKTANLYCPMSHQQSQAGCCDSIEEFWRKHWVTAQEEARRHGSCEHVLDPHFMDRMSHCMNFKDVEQVLTECDLMRLTEVAQLSASTRITHSDPCTGKGEDHERKIADLTEMIKVLQQTVADCELKVADYEQKIPDYETKIANHMEEHQAQLEALETKIERDKEEHQVKLEALDQKIAHNFAATIETMRHDFERAREPQSPSAHTAASEPTAASESWDFAEEPTKQQLQKELQKQMQQLEQLQGEMHGVKNKIAAWDAYYGRWG